jgi:hypothetical protein
MTMMSSVVFSLLLALAIAPTAFSQIDPDCNPLQQTCPQDPALAGALSVDFCNGPSDRFYVAGTDPAYNADGGVFTINESGDVPQINANFYIMFGWVEVTMKVAPGAGIVSTFILMSDDKDEIDWEFIGDQPNEVQTNYFGKGNGNSAGRGAVYNIAGSTWDWHTYALNWTSTQIDWLVDGTIVRTQLAANSPTDSYNTQYPQTPMQLKIGAWAGGDTTKNGAGTVGKSAALITISS